MGNQTGAIEQKANRQCVHHWIIDKDNVGRCVKCGAAKDFGVAWEVGRGTTGALVGIP
jgi:hypothetical protein